MTSLMQAYLVYVVKVHYVVCLTQIDTRRRRRSRIVGGMGGEGEGGRVTQYSMQSGSAR